MVGGVPCVVDGNAHLLSLAMEAEGRALGGLVGLAGRPDVVRVWRAGWEEGSGQDAPCDVYIPVDTDTGRIPGSRVATDWLKDPPAPTKVVSAGIAFSSPLFSWPDRGHTLAQTAQALRDAPDGQA